MLSFAEAFTLMCDQLDMLTAAQVRVLFRIAPGTSVTRKGVTLTRVNRDRYTIS